MAAMFRAQFRCCYTLVTTSALPLSAVGFDTSEASLKWFCREVEFHWRLLFVCLFLWNHGRHQFPCCLETFAQRVASIETIKKYRRWYSAPSEPRQFTSLERMDSRADRYAVSRRRVSFGYSMWYRLSISSTDHQVYYQGEWIVVQGAKRGTQWNWARLCEFFPILPRRLRLSFHSIVFV